MNYRPPTIVINGRTLATSEVESLRGAATHFHSYMGDPDALGKDDHGRGMVAAYRRHMETILILMGVIT